MCGKFSEDTDTDKYIHEHFNRGELFLKLVKRFVGQEDFDRVFKPMVAEYEHEYLEKDHSNRTD